MQLQSKKKKNWLIHRLIKGGINFSFLFLNYAVIPDKERFGKEHIQLVLGAVEFSEVSVFPMRFYIIVFSF